MQESQTVWPQAGANLNLAVSTACEESDPNQVYQREDGGITSLIISEAVAWLGEDLADDPTPRHSRNTHNSYNCTIGPSPVRIWNCI